MGAYEGPTNFLNVGAAPSLMLNFAREKNLTDQISGKDLVTFTRSSIGTYVGADGLIKTAAADEARFDHDADGNCLGLLIEEVRVNRINGGFGTSIRTTDYLGNTSGTGWTMTANAEVAPDGTTTATLLSQSQGLINSAIVWITNIMDSGRTFSVFVKHLSGSVNLHGQFGSGDFFQVNLDTGVNNASPTGRIRDIQLVDYPNGWKRLSIYAVDIGPSLGELVGTAIYLCMNSAASDILIWGWQVEDGSFPTSYIPTSASIVTRSADIAQITGTNLTSFYNQSEGSFYTESILNSNRNYTGTFRHIYQGTLTTTDSNNRIGLIYTSSNLISVDNVTSGSYTFSGSSNIENNDSIMKTAVALKTNDYAISVNGSTADDLGDSGTLSNINYFYIGRVRDNNTLGHLNGHLKQLIYYPARIADIKLQQMTKVF